MKSRWRSIYVAGALWMGLTGALVPPVVGAKKPAKKPAKAAPVTKSTKAAKPAKPAKPAKSAPAAAAKSDEQLIAIVRALPDVKKFAEGRMIFTRLDKEMGKKYAKSKDAPVYGVYVAEDFGDHLTTYDWVFVSARTGKVVAREFKK